MSRPPDWEDEFDQLLARGGSRTTKRSVRILGGPAQEGQSAWQREEVRAVDEEGNIHTFDRAWTTRGLCGCVLTAETGQVICGACMGVICREHAVPCAYCHVHFCPADVVFYEVGEGRVAYCRRHRFIHYLRRFLLGVPE